MERLKRPNKPPVLPWRIGPISLVMRNAMPSPKLEELAFLRMRTVKLVSKLAGHLMPGHLNIARPTLLSTWLASVPLPGSRMSAMEPFTTLLCPRHLRGPSRPQLSSLNDGNAISGICADTAGRTRSRRIVCGDMAIILPSLPRRWIRIIR